MNASRGRELNFTFFLWFSAFSFVVQTLMGLFHQHWSWERSILNGLEYGAVNLVLGFFAARLIESRRPT